MKVICIIWDIACVIALFKQIANSKGDGAFIIGALIAFILVCVLPTYFCFREKKD